MLPLGRERDRRARPMIRAARASAATPLGTSLESESMKTVTRANGEYRSARMWSSRGT